MNNAQVVVYTLFIIWVCWSYTIFIWDQVWRECTKNEFGFAIQTKLAALIGLSVSIIVPIIMLTMYLWNNWSV